MKYRASRFPRVARAALATTFIFVLASCTREQPAPPSTSTTAPAPRATVSLRLKWLYDPGFAGEMVAAKRGEFAKRGLDLAIRPGGFEADSVKLVASGSDTFGVAGADTFLLARAQGVPIVAFAAGYLQTPVVFYAKQTSGITSPQQFIGKRVGVQGGQDTYTVYRTLLRGVNVDPARIREVPVKYDFTPFLTGQVDVWPGYAATQSYILKQQNVPYSVIEPAKYGVTYLGTVYFAREDTIRKHPEWVQGFVDALISGWEYTYSHPQDAAILVGSFDQKTLTPDLVQFNFEKQKGSIVPEGRRYCEFTAADWQRTRDALIEVGLLQANMDVTGAYTDRFLSTHYNR